MMKRLGKRPRQSSMKELLHLQKNEMKYFVANRSTNLEKYASLPSISEDIPDDVEDLSKQIAFTLDNQQDIQCYLVSGFLSCEINGNTYPLAGSPTDVQKIQFQIYLLYIPLHSTCY